jgi:imidazolonepropionase-like amidohydrolase
MIKRCFLFLIACLLTLHLTSAADSPGTSGLTFIKAGHLVDVAAGKIVEGTKILVEGDRIKAVGADLTPPAGATILDLSSAWVLPGMIDCHTHITFQFTDYYADTFRSSPIDNAVYAHVYARRTLDAGFTTCRDVGSGEFVDVALRNAINNREIPGPRLFVAGHALSATGGHGDLSGFSPYLHFDNFNGVADGVDELRKKIRWNIKYGADVIKFTATAGVLSEEESVGAPQFSAEEMKAIVDEAAMWGRKVAAHAHGTEGIKRAVAAGVASIEHGSILDDEAVALMKQHGTFLVPTIYVGYAVEQSGDKWKLPQRLIEKARTLNRQKMEGFRKAIRDGVKIAYGTDAGVFPHGQNARDFRYLVELGMSPIAAVQAATVRAAELLGQTENLGAIQPGKFADIVAVGSDPSKDITVLEKVAFVMKSGQVYKNTLRAAAQP